MAKKRKRKKKKKAKKKWGKIGAPRSAKRRRWMRRMRAAHKGRVLKRSVSGNAALRRRRKKKKKKKRKRR